MFMKKIYRRIVDDFKQKELLSVKILFFVHTSTLYVLYPYLTIHMRELGINVEETAIMSAITPIVTIIMPPIAGMVADRIGNFKVLLSVFSALGGGAALLLLLVPVGRVHIAYPAQTVIGVHCLGHGANLTIPISQTCHHISNTSLQVEHQLATCGYVCLASSEFEAHHQPTSYTIVHTDFNHTLSFRMPRELHEAVRLDHEEQRLMPAEEELAVLVRRLGPERIYFPGPASVAPEGRHVPLHWSRKADLNDEPWLKYAAELPRNSSCTQLGLAFEDLPLAGDVATVVAGGVSFEGCQPLCLATANRKSLCSNSNIEIERDVSLTFWLYLMIRVFIGIIGGTAFAMFEGAVIAILREHSGDYGLQRIYATIGGMISSPLSGVLIDYASKGKGYTDFRPAFYLYAALKLASGLIMLTINLEFKAPAKDVIHDVISVIRNFELVALFIVCFILGSAWGFIESFLFWLLQDMGASRSLMGITITVGGIAGIPLLILSGPIVNRIGHANVLFIGFIFYAIRLIGYSMIYNPWHCLFFEAMESVTSSLSFTAAVTYAAKLSTTNTDSSIQGLIGGLYYGVGKGFGSLTGGYLMKYIGTRPTYQVFAMLSLITGILYGGFNRLFLMKRAALREAQEKDECKKADLEKAEKIQLENSKSYENKGFVEENVEGIKMEKDKMNDKVKSGVDTTTTKQEETC